MVKLISIAGVFLLSTLPVFGQIKTVVKQKSIMTSSFETAFFIKNIDSLRKERLLMDSLLRVNRRMLDTAYTRVDRFNKVIDYWNKQVKGRADSVNVLVATFEEETDRCNKLIKTIDAHVRFFSGLFPRVTNRLQKFAEDNSTATKSVSIDWSTYMQVHGEFVDWGNNMIDTFNLNTTNLATIKDQINHAINSMRKGG